MGALNPFPSYHRLACSLPICTTWDVRTRQANLVVAQMLQPRGEVVHPCRADRKGCAALLGLLLCQADKKANNAAVAFLHRLGSADVERVCKHQAPLPGIELVRREAAEDPLQGRLQAWLPRAGLQVFGEALDDSVRGSRKVAAQQLETRPLCCVLRRRSHLRILLHRLEAEAAVETCRTVGRASGHPRPEELHRFLSDAGLAKHPGCQLPQPVHLALPGQRLHVDVHGGRLEGHRKSRRQHHLVALPQPGEGPFRVVNGQVAAGSVDRKGLAHHDLGL
mmetsp:Transcript_21179/g.50548  ORF Transcript_21179/g.50548 Transcript_21179/m.50548 type:complete len:279 (-) Transcript_21179:373-1209(-)